MKRKGLLPLKYNACTEPCDTLEGPCVCGAWHTMNEHEGRVAGKIEKAGFAVKGTNGSGAVSDDADLRTKLGESMLLECKERPKNDNVTIPFDFIKKVRKQALDRDKEWGIVYTGKSKKDYILMELDTLLCLLNRRKDG